MTPISSPATLQTPTLCPNLRLSSRGIHKSYFSCMLSSNPLDYTKASVPKVQQRMAQWQTSNYPTHTSKVANNPSIAVTYPGHVHFLHLLFMSSIIWVLVCATG